MKSHSEIESNSKTESYREVKSYRKMKSHRQEDRVSRTRQNLTEKGLLKLAKAERIWKITYFRQRFCREKIQRQITEQAAGIC